MWNGASGVVQSALSAAGNHVTIIKVASPIQLLCFDTILWPPVIIAA
jgi:hypothetical protein